MRGAQCLRFPLSSAKYSPAPAHRDPFYDLVPSRLSASQSFCLPWFVRLSGGDFLLLVQKEAKHARGEPRDPRRLAALDTNVVFLLAQKNKSVRRADALQRCLRRIFIARALEREGRTTTPVPSSKEGNYGGNLQTLCSQRLPSSANLVPAPSRRDPLSPKAPTISQTRKLFVKVCANWALSLQIFLVSSGLVRGTSLTGKYLPHSDLCRRSLSSFVFLFSPACAPVRAGDLNSAKRR